MILAISLLAAVARLVSLDDGRAALIEGRSLYIVDARGGKALAPAGHYITRNGEAFVVGKSGRLARTLRRLDGGDPRSLLVASADSAWGAVGNQDRTLLPAVKKRLESFSQQHHVWFRPVTVNQGAVTLKLMFCSQSCEPGVEAQARSAISSLPGVKSVSGPIASTVCFDGYNAAAGQCANSSTTVGGMGQ
jgi:hypothetical protein